MPASVHKAASVLDLFSVERPDWRPTEVADELRIAKSTAHIHRHEDETFYILEGECRLLLADE